MENWLRTCGVLAIITLKVVAGEKWDLDECGVQDRDALPDMHAASPWSAALFSVEGDIFESQSKPQYLNTAILISKDFAITSGSSILADQENKTSTPIHVLYGHRASGRRTFIRVRKVEPLYPAKQPLPLFLDSRSSARIQANSQQYQDKPQQNSSEFAEIYLLHLENPLEVNSFSRPLCISTDVFRNKQQYLARSTTSNVVHLSGYARHNETLGPYVVYFSGDNDWRVNTWESDYITLLTREKQVSFGFLPKHFSAGSALTVKVNNHFYLAGILLRSSGMYTTMKSIEMFANIIQSKAIPGYSLQGTHGEVSHSAQNDATNAQLNYFKKVEAGEDAEAIGESLGSSRNPESDSAHRPPTTYSNTDSRVPPSFDDFDRPSSQSQHQDSQQLIVRLSGIQKSQSSDNFNFPHREQKCTYDHHEGVDIECLSRQRGVSTEDCIKHAPEGAKIRLSCKSHYIPLDGEKVLEKTCDSTGNWLPRKTFACKLECGNVDNSVGYIVHGLKTQSDKWPWHAALFKKVNDTSYGYICGATLISRSILITAAHCVYDLANNAAHDHAVFKVVVGAISSELLPNRKDPQAQEFNIVKVKINEHFNSRTFEADIALVQLDRPVHLTDYVKPVCFPFPSDENKQVSSYQLSEGNQGIVVGFGITEDWSVSRTLQMATLPVVSIKNCTNVLERLPSSSQYCAGYTNGTSVCEGDSGGAQIFKDQISKRFFIQGIVSHGNQKDTLTAGTSRCDHEKYTVFTKVGSFAEWVKEAVYKIEYDYNRR